MVEDTSKTPPGNDSDVTSEPQSGQVPGLADTMKKEIGGRDGPDPTRYGDWEKDGRCIDF